MRKGNFKVRVLSTGMVVMMIMTSFTPLLSQAAGFPDEETTFTESAAEEKTIEENPIDEDSLKETTEEVIEETKSEDMLLEETPAENPSDDENSSETDEVKDDNKKADEEKSEDVKPEEKKVDEEKAGEEKNEENKKDKTDKELEEELEKKRLEEEELEKKRLEEEELKKKELEKKKQPPRHERIFAEVNGEYREFIIESQAEDLDTPWKDESGNEYTWDSDNLCWRDGNGHLFMVDKNYVDPHYGEMCYGDSTDSMVSTSKKIAQNSMNSMVDIICKQCPELAFIAGPLKAIIGEIFGLGGSKDANQEIVDRLKEIDTELKRIENDHKFHVEDATAMTSIGKQFQSLRDSIGPLKDKLGDKLDDYESGRITKEEYNRQVAALYDSTEYGAVKLALAGATNAFFQETDYTIDKISIFDAAYNLQCNHVMFSGESIDKVTPYLIRQLSTYFQAYGLVNTVLDCCEATTVVGSVKQSRKTMLENTGGVFDGAFDASRPGVFGEYEKFFNRNRYVFVDQTSDTSRHVALSQEIYVIMDYEKYSSNGKMGLKDAVPQQKNFPLSEEQMKRLANYANARKTTIYSILLDDVHFKLSILPNNSLWKRLSNGASGTIDENFTTHHLHRGDVTMKEQFRNSEVVYMPYGPQDFTYKTYYSSGYCAPPYDYTMQAIKINRTGTSGETIKLVGTHGTGFINPHMFFFQKQ